MKMNLAQNMTCTRVYEIECDKIIRFQTIIHNVIQENPIV